MKFREAFGDSKYWATMPQQHLHAETHDTLTGLGYRLTDNSHEHHSGIKKVYRKDWKLGGDNNPDLEPHLAKHGWYKLGENNWGDSVYNHPNGAVINKKGSDIDMYGNWTRGDK